MYLKHRLKSLALSVLCFVCVYNWDYYECRRFKYESSSTVTEIQLSFFSYNKSVKKITEVGKTVNYYSTGNKIVCEFRKS